MCDIYPITPIQVSSLSNQPGGEDYNSTTFPLRLSPPVAMSMSSPVSPVSHDDDMKRSRSPVRSPLRSSLYLVQSPQSPPSSVPLVTTTSLPTSLPIALPTIIYVPRIPRTPKFRYNLMHTILSSYGTVLQYKSTPMKNLDYDQAVVKYSTAEEAVDAMNELAWSFGFNATWSNQSKSVRQRESQMSHHYHGYNHGRRCRSRSRSPQSARGSSCWSMLSSQRSSLRSRSPPTCRPSRSRSPSRSVQHYSSYTTPFRSSHGQHYPDVRDLHHNHDDSGSYNNGWSSSITPTLVQSISDAEREQAIDLKFRINQLHYSYN